MTLEVFLDSETRSPIDLTKAGAHRYFADPHTEITLLTYAINDGPVYVWRRGMKMPFDLALALQEGATVYIHNAEFDVSGWNEILHKWLGWPKLTYDRVRDTAAMAAAMALPRSLDKAAAAVRLAVTKDKAGHALMKKMCAPTHWEHDRPVYLDDATRMARLETYAVQDIHVMRQLRRRLLDLRPQEQTVYDLTVKINARGVRVDKTPVRQAIPWVQEALGELNAQVKTITKGEVERALQRNKLLAFLADHVVFPANARRKTLQLWLAQAGDDVPDACLDVIKLRLDAAKTSVAKLNAMDLRTCPDHRLRGSLVYHGATTGRWSSVGVQLQNLPRPEMNNDNCAAAVETIRNGTRERLEWLFGPTLQVVSDCLRSFFIPAPGHQFVVADFTRIEAIVNAWASRQMDLLQAFREGRNVYIEMGHRVFGRPITKADKIEYQISKALVLGAGYGLGGVGFWTQCTLNGIPLTMDFAKDAIDTYRRQNGDIVSNWYDQERAAIRATTHPGERVGCGPVTWLLRSQILWCRLPSGRALAYPYARVFDVPDRHKIMRPRLHYHGIHPVTHQWAEVSTYGAALVENITQAIARDLLVFVMLQVEAMGIANVLSVHDELVAESPIDRADADLRTVLDLMAVPPTWGAGLPLSADGMVLERYGKLP